MDYLPSLASAFANRRVDSDRAIQFPLQRLRVVLGHVAFWGTGADKDCCFAGATRCADKPQPRWVLRAQIGNIDVSEQKERCIAMFTSFIQPQALAAVGSVNELQPLRLLTDPRSN